MGKKQQLQETHGLRTLDEVLPVCVTGIIQRSIKNAKNNKEDKR